MELIGTLGPACRKEQTLLDLFLAGMTGMRLNLSHVRLVQTEELLGAYHRAAKRAGVEPKLIIDMQGPELRVGDMDKPLRLEQGAVVALGADGVPVPGCLFAALTAGMELLLDDGALLLQVEQSKADRAVCIVRRGGVLHARKSIAVPGAVLRPPAVTETDLENLASAARCGVTGVLQPFCTGKDDLLAVRSALKAAGLAEARVIAKVENRAGIAALEELIAHADEICIARGDLGADMPLWCLPAAQKDIAVVCNRAGKAFGVATQLLHSMHNSAVPTRAELSDVFNAVLDGASTLLLTGETAVGHYPVEAMRTLSKTAEQALLFLRRA